MVQSLSSRIRSTRADCKITLIYICELPTIPSFEDSIKTYCIHQIVKKKQTKFTIQILLDFFIVTSLIRLVLDKHPKPITHKHTLTKRGVCVCVFSVMWAKQTERHWDVYLWSKWEKTNDKQMHKMGAYHCVVIAFECGNCAICDCCCTTAFTQNGAPGSSDGIGSVSSADGHGLFQLSERYVIVFLSMLFLCERKPNTHTHTHSHSSIRHKRINASLQFAFV